MTVLTHHTAERVALALGLSMGQIFEGAERPKSASSSVTRVESRVALTSNWSKARLEALGGLGEDARLEPVLLLLDPAEVAARDLTHRRGRSSPMSSRAPRFFRWSSRLRTEHRRYRNMSYTPEMR